MTYGRFNLLHVGHINLFLKMASVADQVVIGVSSGPKNKALDRRILLIDRALREHGDNFIITAGSNPFEVFEIADDMGGLDTVSFFGHDQKVLAAATERAYNWESRTIDRLTSSTALRSHIDNEEWDIVAEIVPPSIINDVIALHKSN